MMLRDCACSARNSAVVKLPDEPSPVPAGMSASVVISICPASPGNSFSASRMIGCWTSSMRVDVLDLGIFQVDAGPERLDDA